MAKVVRVSRVQIGEPGEAADVEGVPAMLLAQQPDSIIDAGQVGPLSVRAASVRGAGHRYDGTPRQDDFCLGTAGANHEWLVAVVADGVSAGPRSHLAARVAVRLGVQLIAQALADRPPEAIDWDALVGTIAGHVLLQARKDANDDSLDARAASKVMATTAAFVIVPLGADEQGWRSCTVVPIGDTSVWILRESSRWEPVTPVKNAGQAVASSAVFALPLLPSNSVAPSTAVLGPGDALFVVTDGIGDPLGAGGGEVGVALAAAWSAPPNRYEFAAQVDFARRSHTDDRTALGIWPDVDAAETSEPTWADPAEPVAEWMNLGPDGNDAAAWPAAAPSLPPGSLSSAPQMTPHPDSNVGPFLLPPPPTIKAWEPMPWQPTEWSGTTDAPVEPADDDSTTGPATTPATEPATKPDTEPGDRSGR